MKLLQIMITLVQGIVILITIIILFGLIINFFINNNEDNLQ
ncbi:hypothetical protein [Clostridium sp.]|nr:hypothetical protein [Clostridium sp.]